MWCALEVTTAPKVRWMRGADSLEEAEGRVAFDVVLLLEAVKLSRVNVHPREHLQKETKREESDGLFELNERSSE